MQVTVQLHVVQTWDAAVRLVLAVAVPMVREGMVGGSGSTKRKLRGSI